MNGDVGPSAASTVTLTNSSAGGVPPVTTGVAAFPVTPASPPGSAAVAALTASSTPDYTTVHGVAMPGEFLFSASDTGECGCVE